MDISPIARSGPGPDPEEDAEAASALTLSDLSHSIEAVPVT